jgi:MFS family permease
VSWRWCFGINLPVCVFSHIIIFIILRKRLRFSIYDTAETRPLTFKLKKMDYLGATLFLGGCICIILGLVWGGSQYPWRSGQIISLLVIGVSVLSLFILTEWIMETDNLSHAPKLIRPMIVHATPMLPLEIFRNWDVCICLWNSLAGGMIMIGMFYYIAIYFTIVFSYPSQRAGQQLLYFLPGLGVGSWISMFFVNRVFHGTKYILIAGSVIMAVATGLFSMAVQQKAKAEVFGFMAMLGVGAGLVHF